MKIATINNLKIACVMPCYKETSHILDVLKKVPDIVDLIYVIDDGCPDKTGELVLKKKQRFKSESNFPRKKSRSWWRYSCWL